MDKAETTKILTLITEHTHRIEDKNISNYFTESFLNILFASNNEYLLIVDAKDRRFLALRIDNMYGGTQNTEKKKYFDTLRKVSAHAFAHYCYTLDISQFNSREVPNTELLQDQQTSSQAYQPIGWLEHCLNTGQLTIFAGVESNVPTTPLQWEQERPKIDIYNSYVKSCIARTEECFYLNNCKEE